MKLTEHKLQFEVDNILTFVRNNEDFKFSCSCETNKKTNLTMLLESYCSLSDAEAQFDGGQFIITNTLVDKRRRPLQSEMEIDSFHKLEAK